MIKRWELAPLRRRPNRWPPDWATGGFYQAYSQCRRCGDWVLRNPESGTEYRKAEFLTLARKGPIRHARRRVNMTGSGVNRFAGSETCPRGQSDMNGIITPCEWRSHGVMMPSVPPGEKATDTQGLADGMDTFNVSQPDCEDRCSDSPCGDSEILQVFSGLAFGWCHFWSCRGCALMVLVSFAGHEPHGRDLDRMRDFVKVPD